MEAGVVLHDPDELAAEVLQDDLIYNAVPLKCLLWWKMAQRLVLSVVDPEIPAPDELDRDVGGTQECDQALQPRELTPQFPSDQRQRFQFRPLRFDLP